MVRVLMISVAIAIALGGVRAFAQPASKAPAPTAPAPAPTPPAPAPTPPAPPPTPGPTPTPQESPAPDAQPAPAPDPKVLEEAKRHFDQGIALFNDANYSAALSEFEQVYRLHPAVGTFYNIGITQKALFRYPDAIASLQKLIDESKNLSPEKRAEAESLIAGMKALLADITFQVAPDNATISIDGRPAGTSPLTKPLQLAAGLHKIEVTAEGYEPQKQEIMVSAEVPMTRTFTLKAIPKTGKVRISSSVPRSTVSVDGKPRGYAPLEVELDAGGHQIEVSAPKHEPRRDELLIVAGQTRDVDVTLTKIVVAKKPWYGKWQVWTTVGLVLIGGTGACAYAGCFDTPQSPLEGTLSPGVGGVQ